MHGRGQREDQRQLRELAELEAGQRAYVEPRLGVVHLGAYQVDQYQGRHAQHVDVRREPDDPHLPDPHHDAGQHRSGGEEHQLAAQLAARRCAVEGREADAKD